MADGGKATIYYSQVNEVVKDVLNYLMIEKPVTTKQYKDVIALHKSLNETGCLKKGTEISKRNPLDDLQAIGKGIVDKPYTVGILITWLYSFLPSYVKKLKSNSDAKGVKVLLKSMAETNKGDAETVKGWLSTHITQRSPAVEFDNVKKSTSLIEAVYKNAKDECVPEIKQIENSSKLKDKLKQYMTDPLCELKYNDILAGCGMQNISEVWKQFVENDEVFNQYSAVCVPYLARMLEVNITVFAYPSKECVSFNYDDSGDDVTITLCFYDDKFVQLVPSSGVLYTVWGRRTCPNNESELVYSGMAGGGLYSNPGSPAEYVCLPYDPDLILNEVTSNPFGSIGHIYGAEYEDNFFGQKVFENDVPCAVCNNPKKSLTMMIPGKTTCVPGWQVEYSGRLASGADSENAASQYVCVHALPDVLENGLSNDNGKLFYPVRVVCGSLHCPPYENNALMPCVVCSK